MVRYRIILIEVLIAIPFLILIARLFSLQVVSGEEYRQSIKNTGRSMDVMNAPRGRILDRNGEVLAYDERSFDLYIMLDDFGKKPNVIVELANLLKRDMTEISRRISDIARRIEAEVARRPTEKEQKKLRNALRRTPYLLAKGIPLNPAALAIEVHPEIYAGLSIRQNLRRYYPYNTIAAHIIGYVGRIGRTKEEFEKLVEDNYFTEGFEYVIGEDGVERLVRRGAFDNEVIGRTGVELYYNDTLRYYSGLQAVERTREGVVYNVFVRPQPGKDVRLTIDINLQQVAQEALARVRGAAVVMDVRSGEILALASSPTFDLNDFIPPNIPANIEELYFSKASGYPTINRVISGEYQIGSIFKVVTATAGLMEKKITPQTPFVCKGKFSEKFEHFHCWIYLKHGGTHGEVDLKEAIKRSCNIFFFSVGNITGIEPIAFWSTRYGLGAPTGIDLYGEESGIVPTAEYMEKLKTKKRKWLYTDTLNVAIGQGEISATPMQIVRMMSAVANGGVLITPWISKEAHTPNAVRLDIPQSVLDAIKEGLEAVVQEEGGTAHNTALGSLDCAGKTSSAQTGGEREAHAWFAGFTPTKEPRYAFVVMVEHGGSGAEAATPIAAKILEGLAAGKE